MKTQFITLIFMLATYCSIVAQSTSPDTVKSVSPTGPFTFVEQNPEFPGGDVGLIKFLQANVKYPAYEMEKDIQGKVLVRFVVNEDGSVSDAQVMRSVSPGLDAEAIRATMALPKFKPGMQQGRLVKVYFNLPIVFKLTEPAKPDSIKTDVFTFVEQNPEFPGGDDALWKFIRKNIKYPADEKKKRIQGKVLLRFVVAEDGSVIEPVVLRGVSGGLDSEALRVVNTLPKFKPGMQKGKPVKVYFNIPVEFYL